MSLSHEDATLDAVDSVGCRVIHCVTTFPMGVRLLKIGL